MYRSEIDGLRALAVIPVIFFHAGFNIFSGGFVGVDVFFVISGYLITSIIISELDNQSFSIVNFYERRARRILPALFVTMAISLLFALFLFMPHDLKSFAQSLAAVSFFISNILFWKDSGYFEAESELEPLLHTWSLAIEEQFYIFFPIFLLLFWKFGMRVIIILLTSIFFISIFASEWASIRYPDAGFYLLPFRGWELLIGAFIGLYLHRYGFSRKSILNEVASLTGLILIITGIIIIDKTTPFPGFWALVPCLGTALIILFGIKGTFVSQILSKYMIVKIGLISYSAYLFHQPILAFGRYVYEDISNFFLFSLCVLSFLLAFISWKYIENPFRDKKIFSRKLIFNFSLIGMISFSLIGFYINKLDGFVKDYSVNEAKILRNFVNASSFVKNNFKNHMHNSFKTSHKRKVLLIGDSFAQDLANVVYETQENSNISLVTYYIPASCGILLLNNKKMPLDRPLECKSDFLEDSFLNSLFIEADEVWLASVWLYHFTPYLSETLENLRMLNANLKVFGPKYFGVIKPRDFMKYGVSTWSAISIDKPHNRFLENLELTRKIVLSNDLPFIDVQQALCEGKDFCAPYDGKNMISYDGSHLTPYGVQKLSDNIKDLIK